MKKNLILLLLPLSVSFNNSPQTKGITDIIGCAKTCAIAGSKVLARCSKKLPDDDSKDDSKKQ